MSNLDVKHEKHGKKRRLYFYRHAMDKVWRSLLIFEIALWIVWWFAVDIPAFHPPTDKIFARTGFAILALLIIVIIMRSSAFVQVRDDYILMQLGFYRLKVPFEVIDTMRYSDLSNALAGSKLSRSERRFIQGYRGNATVATLLLKRYPKPERSLRLFMPKYMFLPSADGFLLYIPEIMEFNTEFDSRFTAAKGQGADMYTPQESLTTSDDPYNLAAQDAAYEDSPGLYNLFEE